jgi:hypothetical protein
LPANVQIPACTQATRVMTAITLRIEINYQSGAGKNWTEPVPRACPRTAAGGNLSRRP